MISVSQDDPCVCFLYEACTLYEIENADELRRKLSKIDSLRKQTHDEEDLYFSPIADRFFKTHLVSAANSEKDGCASVIL